MNNEELTRSIISLNQLTGLNRNQARTVFDGVPDFSKIGYFDLLTEAVRNNQLRRSQPIGDFVDAGEYADSVLFRCGNEQISIVNCYSDEYPEAMRFEDHPLVIYCRGDLSILSNPKRAAVIGTRNPDKNGVDFAYKSGMTLAENGYTVISGLAQGCDTAAHNGCLAAGGKTVAFVPSNISKIVPKQNIGLAQRIVDSGGLLVSEFSPFQIPNAEMYIARDRLQAGCSNFVITSEFDANSGTIQTLTYASGFGKPIYTLEALTAGTDFNGLQAARKEKIRIKPVTWEQLNEIIVSGRTE